MLSNRQDSIIINTEKEFKISQHRFNWYGGQVENLQVKKIYRSSGMRDNLISDSLDVGLHLSIISEV